MQREIKFRGKRLGKGEWIYGCLLTGFFLRGGQDIPYIMTADGTDYDCFEDIQEENGIYEVLPETVGQYTGLHDKNGKEIYEGDIFHLGDRNILYVVVWHDTGLRGKQARASSYVGLEHWKERIKVIGNVYENPELLEVSE